MLSPEQEYRGIFRRRPAEDIYVTEGTVFPLTSCLVYIAGSEGNLQNGTQMEKKSLTGVLTIHCFIKKKKKDFFTLDILCV